VLVKSGKIKKERALKPIKDEEIPFDIPASWEWVRLGEIVDIVRGITFPSDVKYKTHRQGTTRCATTGSVQKEYNSNADIFVPTQYVKKENQWLKSNDIIMSSANSRELVGKTCIWQGTEKKVLVVF
jgi:type I restriction enzyme S subunit